MLRVGVRHRGGRAGQKREREEEKSLCRRHSFEDESVSEESARTESEGPVGGGDEPVGGGNQKRVGKSEKEKSFVLRFKVLWGPTLNFFIFFSSYHSSSSAL